ncbi:MAG: O-antigen ligase family protein [Proteobacteria bacterium]|nr:O-antigen ligase family protein [Pseudomonadota bacterium]
MPLKRLMPDFKKLTSEKLFWIIAFSFPLCLNAINHWGSGLFASIFVLSLFLIELKSPQLETHEKLLCLGFVIVLAATSLSLMNGQDLHRGLKRIGKLQYLILFIPVYIVMRKRDIDISTPFLYGIIVSGPTMMVISVLQVFGSNLNRALGGYNELVFGSVAMIFTMIVTAAIFTKHSSKTLKILLGVSGFSTIYACVLSGTRGALIALPLVMVFQIAMLRASFQKKSLYLLGMILFISLSCAGSYFSHGMIRNRSFQAFQDLSQFIDQSNKDTSVAWRLLMWEDAIKIWKKHPFIGTGLGDFRNDVEEMMEKNESDLSKSWKHAHNFYLEYLATTGIVGFLATTLILLVWPFYLFHRKWKLYAGTNTDFASLAGMSTILTFSLIGVTWYWPARSPMVITYVFCLLIFLTASHIERKNV